MMEIFSSLYAPTASELEDVERFKRDPRDLSSTCDECLLAFTQLLNCGKCKEVKYCGKDCQVKAWRGGHKISCGKITIRPIPGKGLGIIALRDLHKGEIIAREMPMLNFATRGEMRNEVSRLSDSQKRKIMSLHDCHNGDDKKFLGVFFSNCFVFTGEIRLLYYFMSRFNHSCVPNIRVDTGSTDPRVKPTPAIALKDIKQGDELCWCYIVTSSMYQDRAERRARLKSGHRILCCQCESCSLTGKAQVESDNNRLKLKQVEDRLATTFNPLIVPALVREKHDLFIKEGLDTPNNIMHLTKDLMLASLSGNETNKYRLQGLSQAKFLHDEDMIEYFTKYRLKMF